MLFVSIFSYAGGVSVSVTEKIKKDRKNTKSEEKHTMIRTSVSTQKATLKVTISNLSKETADIQLEWYFFERPTIKRGRKGEPTISEKGKETISLEAKKKIKKTIESQEYEKTEVKKEKNRDTKRDDGGLKKTYKGSTYGGYVVLARKDGKIIAKKASDSKFLTKAWMEKLTQ